MKALAYDKYGSPDVLEVREIARPVVTDDGVLVRIHAASVNPVDWHTMTGTPYLVRLSAGLRKPKSEATGRRLRRNGRRSRQQRQAVSAR